MVLREIRLEGVKWIHVARTWTSGGFFVDIVNEPSGPIKDGEFID
jgi:hypothetical protein